MRGRVAGAPSERCGRRAQYNPAGIAADVSNWRIVDNIDDLATKAFVVPAGTVIPANGYVSYNESQLGFRLSSNGETISLARASVLGALTGYIYTAKFGGSANGESLGRNTLSTGQDVFLREVSPTPGAANVGANVGPIVISRVRLVCDVCRARF